MRCHKSVSYASFAWLLHHERSLKIPTKFVRLIGVSEGSGKLD